MITEMIGKPDPYVKLAKKFSLPWKKIFLKYLPIPGCPYANEKKRRQTDQQ